MIPQAFTS